jgi:hypothetical protein
LNKKHNKQKNIRYNTVLKTESMKQITLTIAFILSITQLFSQELLSKKGEKYLPEKGDWSVGIDAVPFLNYTGRLLSTAGSTSPNVSNPSAFPLAINGKYFTADQKCYRSRVRLAALSNTVRNSVVDELNSTTDTVYTQDSKKTTSANVTLSFGVEKRKGKTRLQGLYGAEGVLLVSTGKTKINYGNDYSSTHVSVTSTDFSASIPSGGYTSSSSLTRITETKQGTSFGIGARGLIGAEYFILPKFSIAAELGITLMYTTTNDGYSAQQSWDIGSSSSKSKRLINGGGSSLGIDTDNNGGQLSINFYF